MTRDEILNMPAGREIDSLIAVRVIDPEWEKVLSACPKYSTDIAAAWEVVDKMRKSFWVASLVADTNLWRVTFYTHTHRKTHEAINESAPLAICRAALLAVTK
jgi:hypothetical protein